LTEIGVFNPTLNGENRPTLTSDTWYVGKPKKKTGWWSFFQ